MTSHSRAKRLNLPAGLFSLEYPRGVCEVAGVD
jgi:hypothetical protein